MPPVRGNFSVIQVGDWDKARALFDGDSRKVKKFMHNFVMAEAHLAQRMIVERITDQGRGDWSPLADNTIRKRKLRGFRGTKALLVRGDLRRSIKVHSTEKLSAFVGVHRSARGQNGQALVNVAELNEYGSRPILIRITPRMRRFLFALQSFGTVSRGKRKGQLRRATARELSTSRLRQGPSRGFVIVQIPARPFLRPVLSSPTFNPSNVGHRFEAAVQNAIIKGSWEQREIFGGSRSGVGRSGGWRRT